MNTSFNQDIPLAIAIKYGDRAALLDMLKNAQVSVGHLQGRLISVPGCSGKISFSKVASRIDDLYQSSNVSIMQLRQKQYESESSYDMNPFLPLSCHLL